MSPTRRILIAIDETEASRHAVEHVGHALAGETDVTVRLMHVAGPLPTELLEHGGASDPAEEARLGAELEARQARWLGEERVRFQPVFRDAEERLVAAGVDPNAISTLCCDSIPEDDLAELILAEAERSGCDTVVVGRRAYPRWREFAHQHLGRRLQKHENGLHVEVVP